MSSQGIARLIGGAILIFIIVVMASSGTYVVHPGYRGVEVTMGKVSPAFKPEGFGLKAPFITAIYPISVRQQTAEDKAECYSSDLQQIQIELRVLFRVPESSVVKLFREYFGEPFESLVAPRVHEALKEVTAMQSAEQIVKNREQIKTRALEVARKKVGTLLVVEDIVIQNIALTKELEHAIEAKMVQEQEAAKSKYFQQRAQIEADTAVIQAKGEAESIRIRGQALKENPAFVDLKIVDKWDGLIPLVIGGGDNYVLPLQDLERLRQSKGNANPTSQTQPAPARRPTFGNAMNQSLLPKLIGVAVLVFAIIVASSAMTYVVEPGTRGIKVTLGKTAEQFLAEGFGFKAPFITTIVPVNVRQKTQSVRAECFSSDLQQVILDLRVLYRVPEQSVVQIYQQFAGDPFDSLIAPRVQEALKEVTAMQTAEQIVKSREEIKQKALAAAKQKIGAMLTVEDIVIRNIDLSKELERAIEAKMVAEQEAAQARFTQVQTQVEAETAIIRARGEGEAIKVRGEALKLNPAFLRLQIVERWNGKSPLVVPADVNNTGAALLLPLGPAEKPSAP